MTLDDFIEKERSINTIALLSTPVYLKSFFSEKVIESVRNLDVQNNNQNNDGLHGLILAAVVCLSGYIDAVVNAPELVGIKPDFDYYDYTHFTKGRGKSITRNATRGGHELSEVIDKANTLAFHLVGVSDWKYLSKFKPEIESTINVLSKILTTCYNVKDLDDKEIDSEMAINLDAANLMLVTFTNVMSLFHLYTDYFYDNKDLPEYDEVFNELQVKETRFDSLFLSSDDVPKHPPVDWAKGYAVTIHETLKSIALRDNLVRLSALDNLIPTIDNWEKFEKYTDELFKIFGLQSSYSKFRYILTKNLTDSLVKSIKGEVRPHKSPERLLSIIGNRARIIDSCSSSGSVLNFSCLLDGAVIRSKNTGEKVRLIKFIHDQGHGEENYSLGIFMPAYGSGVFETNGSIWWIFYYIGNNHSGTASRQMAEVENIIKQNEQYIDLDDIIADEEEFLAYCEDPGYLRLDTENKCIDQIVGKLRGTYPELLIANYLTNKAFYPVRLRITPNCLNGVKDVSGDLDVVGFQIKDNLCQIVIFESKGKGCSDRELDEKLARFSRTITWLNEHIKDFGSQYIPDFYGEYFVNAIFVSLTDLHLSQCKIVNKLRKDPLLSITYNPKVPSNIKLWDLPLLLKKLKEVGTPDIFCELIKELPVAIVLK